MTETPLQRLLTIMKTLRDPQAGCPWDKEQTFETIAPYTLEETYEVLDAIARKDYADVRDELGDLLFQVVFYAQMGSEQGLFEFDDICNAIADKLERRHPQIFGDEAAWSECASSKDVLVKWEARKALERADKSLHSALDDIPSALPALMKAHKIQKRCSNVGFDWTTLGPVLDKVYEEIDEVMFEARQAVIDEKNSVRKLAICCSRPLIFHVISAIKRKMHCRPLTASLSAASGRLRRLFAAKG